MSNHMGGQFSSLFNAVYSGDIFVEGKTRERTYGKINERLTIYINANVPLYFKESDLLNFLFDEPKMSKEYEKMNFAKLVEQEDGRGVVFFEKYCRWLLSFHDRYYDINEFNILIFARDYSIFKMTDDELIVYLKVTHNYMCDFLDPSYYSEEVRKLLFDIAKKQEQLNLTINKLLIV